MENQVSNVARTEFQPVVALELMAVNFLSVNKCPVLAAKIDDKELAILRHDRGMLARHARIGNHQVAIDLAADRVGRVIQRKRLLIVSRDKNRDGKDAGDARMR